LERPDLYVVARFLDVLYGNGQPMKKTNIQMRVGLNYARFSQYLEWLQAHGMVQRMGDPQGDQYGLSPKGVEAYHSLVDWIRDTLQGMKI
jgi:predicted transcriptional regulator